MDISDYDVLAVKDVLNGRRQMADLIKRVGSRRKALAVYAEVIATMFPSRCAEGKCEACGRAEATSMKCYTWHGVVDYQIPKTLALATLLFPLILICELCIPGSAHLLFGNAGIDQETVRFETHHGFCNSCHHRLKRRNILVGILLFFFGLILLISFATSIITGISTLVATFNWGWTHQELKYFIPAFLVSTIIMILSKMATARLPVILTMPSSIRRIERGGFSPSETGRLN